MDELEATPVRIAEIETFREGRVLDGSAYLAAEKPGALEDVVEPRAIDIERDFIRVGGGPLHFRREEHDQCLTDPDRRMFAFELVATGQLEVEAAEPIGVSRSKGEMVDAEHPHGANSNPMQRDRERQPGSAGGLRSVWFRSLRKGMTARIAASLDVARALTRP